MIDITVKFENGVHVIHASPDSVPFRIRIGDHVVGAGPVGEGSHAPPSSPPPAPKPLKRIPRAGDVLQRKPSRSSSHEEKVGVVEKVGPGTEGKEDKTYVYFSEQWRPAYLASTKKVINKPILLSEVMDKYVILSEGPEDGLCEKCPLKTT
jgi:hypothetical protein